MSTQRGGVAAARRPQRTTAGAFTAKYGASDLGAAYGGYGEPVLSDEQIYSNQLPQQRVDLNKLKVQTLRKYTKQYEVGGVHPTSSKEDIAKAVSEHWNSVQITEEAVLQNLLKVRGRH